ncbi:unnamed protein product [Lactuca virosa]|uniref:U1-type domain-containing protein n=1 Tax=Lactuca virosa TaxID=75947 RepID=A0AAU9ND16_9ASTR|nr:unnamed protein product [Lactuca virosa]
MSLGHCLSVSHLYAYLISLDLLFSPVGTLTFSPLTMKFKRRLKDAEAQGQQNPFYHSQSSSSSSPYTYYTEQGIRGFPTGDFSGGHGGPAVFRGRFDMRDAFQREIEKERIREEFIAEEMARKRILEEVVRHELMMEREMMAMRSGGGFPSPYMPLPLPGSHNNLFDAGILHRQPIGLEERIIISLDEKYSRGGGGGGYPLEIRDFNVLPYQRFADAPIIQEIPTPLPESSQKEVIVLRKPKGETLTGAKRKPTPPVAGDSSGSYSDTSKKKIREEWNCAICQVTATSERGLNEHLKGKKHQMKEASLIAQKTGANCGLGVATKKPVVKSVKLDVTRVNLSSKEKNSKPRKRSRSGNQTPSMDSSKSSTSSKKEDEMKGEKNSDKFKFWCEMCKVGAFSEKVMNNHKEGKKHSVQLVELLQKGKSVIPCDIEEKTGTETKETEVKLVEEEEEVTRRVGV